MRQVTQDDFVPFDWNLVSNSYRRNLPHLTIPVAIYFITFRLADSLPHELSECWHNQRDLWLATHPRPWDEAAEKEFHRRFTVRMERWLDAGHGACVLRNERCRNEVIGRLEFRHGTEYDLGDWVIMPNHVHVHVLLQPHLVTPLHSLLKPIKGVSSRYINQLLGLSGTLWMDESFNHIARSLDHLKKLQTYIRNNPVKAKLPSIDFSHQQRWTF